MPTSIRRHTSYTIEIDGKSFAATFEPVTGLDPILKQLSDGRFVLGYLSQDSDTENPLENSDGMGKIYDRRSRHARKESIDKFFEETGLGRDGEPENPRNPHAVLLDVYDHSGEAWSIHGEGMQCRWDTTRMGGVWVPDEACLEHIQSKARQMLLPEGTKISYESKHNPDGTTIMRPAKPGEHSYRPDENVVPDERYYNVITWTLPDGRSHGGYKNFVTAAMAAAKAMGIKLDKDVIVKNEYKVAVECARQALESFNSWLSGDCYGVVVEVLDAEGEQSEDEDACWGYIGHKYAEETLTDEVESKVKRMEKEIADGVQVVHPDQHGDGAKAQETAVG